MFQRRRHKSRGGFITMVCLGTLLLNNHRRMRWKTCSITLREVVTLVEFLSMQCHMCSIAMTLMSLLLEPIVKHLLEHGGMATWKMGIEEIGAGGVVVIARVV